MAPVGASVRARQSRCAVSWPRASTRGGPFRERSSLQRGELRPPPREGAHRGRDGWWQNRRGRERRANEEMQLTKRGSLAGPPAAGDRCRPAFFTKSRFAADLWCYAGICEKSIKAGGVVGARAAGPSRRGPRAAPHERGAMVWSAVAKECLSCGRHGPCTCCESRASGLARQPSILC